MYPTIIDFGPIGIHSYGLMLATAFITSVFVMQYELKRRGFLPDVAATIVLAAAIGGVVGAKIYAALLDGRITLTELVSTSGLVWYGGFLGGCLAVLIVVIRSPNPTSPQLILSGQPYCSATGSGGSVVSWLAMGTMDRRPIFRGRWRSQMELCRRMNASTRHLSMRRLSLSHSSGSSGRSAASWRQLLACCLG